MVEIKRVLTKDGRVNNLRSGEKVEIIVKSKLPALLIDSHTHIQSGSCAPLPILWDRIPGGLEIPRQPFNILSYGVSPLAADIQTRETSQIGDKLVAEIEGTYRKTEEVSKKFYGERDIFSVAVVNMMDMEYAWIEGYKGERIYHEDGENGRWYFYRRKSVREPKEKWEKVYLPWENHRTFSIWKKQYFHTREAIINNSLRLLGMYHYDPRRWNYSRRERLDENLNKGPWDYPFNEIVSSNGEGIFIGFKMYPPLGYKPLDLRLKFLYDSSIEGDCFYGRCEREGIPIMVHCSQGGVRVRR